MLNSSIKNWQGECYYKKNRDKKTAHFDVKFVQVVEPKSSPKVHLLRSIFPRVPQMSTDLLNGQMPPALLQLLGSAKHDKQIFMKNSGTKLQAPKRYILRNIQTKTQLSNLCISHLVYTPSCIYSTLCILLLVYTLPYIHSTCIHSTLYTRHAHGENIHTSAHTVTILM